MPRQMINGSQCAKLRLRNALWATLWLTASYSIGLRFPSSTGETQVFSQKRHATHCGRRRRVCISRTVLRYCAQNKKYQGSCRLWLRCGEGQGGMLLLCRKCADEWTRPPGISNSSIRLFLVFFTLVSYALVASHSSLRRRSLLSPGRPSHSGHMPPLALTAPNLTFQLYPPFS